MYPGYSTDVEENEGLSTPAEERGDILIRNIWKHQTDCILDVHITNLDAPSNVHRKPEAVLLPHKCEIRNTSKPVWTSTITFLLLWSHVMEVLGN